MRVRAIVFTTMVLLVSFASGEQAFEEIASMNETRQYPGLALLPDGKVLAVTGHPLGGKSLKSAEVYDPSTDTWTGAGPLHVPRNGVSPEGLVTLPDGNILIAGGGSHAASTAAVELYDPEKKMWVLTNAMETRRASHTTTLLPDGRVLVIGGISWSTNKIHNTAEIFDPVSYIWSNAGAMESPRVGHSTILLSDGRVLVMGGADEDPYYDRVLATCELYDPSNNEWESAPPMLTARRAFRAILLRNGQVLVVAGSSGTRERSPELSECELFDPVSNTWTSTGALSLARWGPTVSLLPDGCVLATGGLRGRGGRIASTEIYDPENGQWTPGPDLNHARNGHRAITLRNGTILIVGGYSRWGYLNSCEKLTP